ncbi:MAG: tetratricopeptide repeat protein [Elusimicrobia bacterium]|nr:tetratricopeptide repeat protein [Elusimicrobiota bacterium]
MVPAAASVVVACLLAALPANAGTLAKVGERVEKWGEKKAASLQQNGHDKAAGAMASLTREVGAALSAVDKKVSGGAAVPKGEVRELKNDLRELAQDKKDVKADIANGDIAAARDDRRELKDDRDKLKSDLDSILSAQPAGGTGDQTGQSSGAQASPAGPPAAMLAPEIQQTRDATDLAARRPPDLGTMAGRLEQAVRQEDTAGSFALPSGARVSLPQDQGPDPESRAAASAKMAENAMAMGDYAKAARDAQRAIDENPRNDEAYLALSQAQSRAGDLLAALKAAEAATKLDPRNLRFLRQLALVYFKTGRYHDALAVLTAVLRSKSANAKDWAETAAVLYAMHDSARAIRALEQAARLDPRHRAALEQARHGGGIRYLESDDDLGVDAAPPPPRRHGPLWPAALAGLAALAAGALALRRSRRGAASRSATVSTAKTLSFAERFETVRVLSQSEGEEVVEARDKRLERLVALRKLRCADAERRGRVSKAAKAAAAVRHPALLETYEIAEDDSGLAIVTEAWSGVTAAELLVSAERLPAPQAVRMLKEACGALSAAHSKGVAHGRLGPAALLVTAAGETKLVGFALETRGSIDDEKRADVRALGACLYELTTGSRHGPDAPAASSRQEGLPAGLDALVADAAGPSPRVGSAKEFASRLKALE